MLTSGDIVHAETKNNLLIYALSGLGKSSLCAQHPSVTYDTDHAFFGALAEAFPTQSPRERNRSWRALARSQPWDRPESDDFLRWSSTRRRFVSEILHVLQRPAPTIVFTNFTFLPWPYLTYYGVTLGSYQQHWKHLTRVADNDQTEGHNNRLEGFCPVIRLPPGQFLSDQRDLAEMIEKIKQY
jgi:hypothetical protein